ncbi:hypothetical protein GOP47_0008939 [Adiantum capillus-veneris]|uniref:Pentatricopeptide repeat-containing protein n=1 Tax=Adiantum capillus-veneris TaxID=13818 RepID=A0A9D4UZK0_ADICA|nr:hypothetical protein GOP47_0008939 [Adiantum capillus-veneris]
MRARGVERQSRRPCSARKLRECAQNAKAPEAAVTERQELKIEVSTQTRKGLGINVSISQDLYVCLLQSYGRQRALTEGRELHGFIVQHEFDSSPHLGNLLINLYTRCGTIADARGVFNRMEAHDIYACSMMISGFAHLGHAQDALALYKQTEMEGTQLDRVTCLAGLKACAAAGDLYQGV